MPIEIVKRGVVPGEIPRRVSCNYCRSVLRFSKGDAKFVADQRDGDYLEFTCPVCGESVTMSVGLYDRSASG